MSETLARLDAFIAAWRERLCGDTAEVRFEARALAAPPGLHAACADAFVTGLGLQPIGGNWELLDAEAGVEGARSARAALAAAFSRNMVFSREPWLGEAGALAMAGDFSPVSTFAAGRSSPTGCISAGIRSHLRPWNGPSSPSTMRPSRCCLRRTRTERKRAPRCRSAPFF